jgi:hypothetical protein
VTKRALAALVAGACVASAAVAQDAPPRGAENAPTEGEMTAASDLAVQRALAWLATQQNPDGSFGGGRYGRHVGITGLACLAFLADGHMPGRGGYGHVVEKGLDFVLANVTETGLVAADTSHGPMYGHGFATLFLGEVYGMTAGGPDTAQSARVHDALVKAVRLIVQSQNPDGGFKYQLTSGGSAWPRSAAGVASLYYAGIYEDDAISEGLEYLERTAFPGQRRAQGAHYFYGHYYAVQTMYLAGGEHWGAWWPAIREELLELQNPDGSWSDNHAGSAYGTAMALIILQMPKRYLPIFQK